MAVSNRPESEDAIEALRELLALSETRVELVADIRNFFNQRRLIAVLEVENIGAPSGALAAVTGARAKMTDEFRAFVTALRAKERDTHVFSGSVGHD